MSEQINRGGHVNYGSTAEDPLVSYTGENRELRILSENISTNVYTINSSTRNLQGTLITLGTNRDTLGLRDQVHVWQLSANQVIKATTSDVARLSALARGANKVQRLQVDKITNHFKEAVEGYSDVQLKVAEKLRKSQPKQLSTIDDEEASLLEDDARQQLQIQQQLQFETDMSVEREQRITQIETDILDVNQIMRQLSTVVHQQSQAIDSIESHIESVRGNVEAGGSELQAAQAYQSKTRRRNICLLATLVVALIALVGIIIWSSR